MPNRQTLYCDKEDDVVVQTAWIDVTDGVCLDAPREKMRIQATDTVAGEDSYLMYGVTVSMTTMAGENMAIGIDSNGNNTGEAKGLSKINVQGEYFVFV